MENIHILKERLSMQFTSRDLLDLLEDSIVMKNENPKDLKQTEKKYVYGISGIQMLLNCSESSAKRLKKSGVIDDAIIQNGRKIIIDVDMAMELLKSNKPGRVKTNGKSCTSEKMQSDIRDSSTKNSK